MIIQKKMNKNGQVVDWELDEGLIRGIIPWAKKNPRLLSEELGDMHRKFPFFYATLFTSERISDGKTFCPRCGDLITFVSGEIMCISCQTTFRRPSEPYLGFVGQIPDWIGVLDIGGRLGQKGVKAYGHPFLKHIHKRLMSAGEQEKKLMSRYFLTLDEGDRTKVFFAPPVYAVYPNNWPRSQPRHYVEREYFDKVLFSGFSLGYGSFHAYSHDSNRLLLLCTYGSWHRVSMRVSIEQRIVPKVMIDVMIADLEVVGKLRKVVNDLGADVHSVYNWIGKSGRTERFKREFDRYVHIDS